MGHFRVVVEIGNRVGERFVTIEALVDTGATYTWVPRDMLGTLGVVPDEEWPFILADGREVRYPMGWMQIKIGGRAQPTIFEYFRKQLARPANEAWLVAQSKGSLSAGYSTDSRHR